MTKLTKRLVAWLKLLCDSSHAPEILSQRHSDISDREKMQPDNPATTKVNDQRPIILLTGATGYIGGRLLKSLERSGHRLRCLARRPDALRARVAAETEVVAGDVLDPASLKAALQGVRTAYYMVHSMGTGGDFEDEDRQSARNFGEAAREAGLKQIIYLGGLGESDETLSPHLRSRHEVGRILGESGVPVIEFRASIVIGSGSFSFEMIRALTERLPVMIAPRWVATPAQPIAIEDLLAYLVEALTLPPGQSRIFEIGGTDQASYGEIMHEYARQRGLRRFIIPVPVLTPHLSSLWLGLITPIYARIGRKLIESLRHPTVVRDQSALEVFGVRPRGIQEAIARALRNEDREYAETRWSDALSSGSRPASWGGVRFGSRLVDSRIARVKCVPAQAFEPIRRIGGQTGWYYGDWLWGIRGFLDLLAGGVGLRRGRRDPEWLHPGETLDFWRVEAFEPNRLLRLTAEMKLPGRAWLEFEVVAEDSGSTIRQTAIFDPVGLSGLLYWYLLFPLHQFIFGGMLRGIVAATVREYER
ncbi:MAG: SDR family oxidoreductase [Blastocatellia bacterium]